MNRIHQDPTIFEIHLGNLLNEKLKEHNLTHAALERKLGRTNGSIKRLIKRPSLPAYLIWELSLALNHNFFQHLADKINEKAGKTLDGSSADKEIMARQQEEIRRLTDERDYLKKMIDILAKK